jgi:hypothetical protein
MRIVVSRILTPCSVTAGYGFIIQKTTILSRGSTFNFTCNTLKSARMLDPMPSYFYSQYSVTTAVSPIWPLDHHC